MAFSLAGFVILFIGVLLQVNEMNYTYTLLDFLIAWHKKRLLGLTRRNTKRLTVIINLMIKVLMVQAFWPLVLTTAALLTYPTILAHLDPESGFMIIPSIFFSVCLFVFIVQYCCITCAGFVAWSVPFFYLLFKFKELHEQFKRCVRRNDQVMLMTTISQHNSVAIQVKLIDDVFKFVVFVLYYFASPALMMCLYLSTDSQTVPMARLFCFTTVVIVYFVVFYLNFVSYEAAKPRNMLQNYLFKNTMPLRIRLKIHNFIESLNGSDIGFHCWNMFAMNSYTFYQYMSSCAYSYLLCVSLFG